MTPARQQDPLQIWGEKDPSLPKKGPVDGERGRQQGASSGNTMEVWRPLGHGSSGGRCQSALRTKERPRAQTLPSSPASSHEPSSQAAATTCPRPQDTHGELDGGLILQEGRDT